MKITLFTTRTCGVCQTVKRFLDYKKVPYEVIPIDEDEARRQEIYDLVGYSIVPVTIVERNGERQIIAGYQPSQLGAAIG